MTLVRYCIAAFFCFDLDGDPNTAKVHTWIDLCDGRAVMWWAYIRVPSKEHAGSDSGSGDYLLHRRTCGLDGGSSRGIGGLCHRVRPPEWHVLNVSPGSALAHQCLQLPSMCFRRTHASRQEKGAHQFGSPQSVRLPLRQVTDSVIRCSFRSEWSDRALRCGLGMSRTATFSR